MGKAIAHTKTSFPTYTGKLFDLSDFSGVDIDIYDIAASLSKQCRYLGHGHAHYSVAEHSYHLSIAAPQEAKLEALLHDAAETYIGDITAPAKAFLGDVPKLKELDDRLTELIFRKFGATYPIPKIVKQLDRQILLN